MPYLFIIFYRRQTYIFFDDSSAYMVFTPISPTFILLIWNVQKNIADAILTYTQKLCFQQTVRKLPVFRLIIIICATKMAIYCNIAEACFRNAILGNNAQ